MNAMSAISPALDLAVVKQRQQATWSSGDYHMIGTQIVIVSELLLEALDVHSTERVLDVATGSGNAAMAAARRGCTVTGVDYVPALLERARRRAEAEGLEIEYVEGDAEALPFDDGAFDVTSSVFGAMFAPDQEQTARELVRVTRHGGRIGLVAHAPEGFIGQLFKTNAAHVPPPAGLRSPIQWGTEARLRELFSDAIGERMPAGGGTCRPITLNTWPMNPLGVWATLPIRPPARVTRTSSCAARSGSGANIDPKTETVTSNAPSGKGRASASPSTRSIESSSASARRRARSSSSGT